MIPNTERLVFRRQFIIGSRIFERDDWVHLPLDDRLFLSVHPDLQITQSFRQNSQLILLGYLIDPEHPDWSNEEILQDIHQQCSSFEQLLQGMDHCGGRWIILYKDGKQLKLFHDACGMRQVFYTVQPEGMWCASQASTLADHLGIELDENEDLQTFLHSPQYHHSENFWPGDGSPYCGIKHLTPNHYLDLHSGKTARYWPRARLQPIALREAVQQASNMLIGSMKAIANRSEVMLPVTAGWDSRILLAASRHVSSHVFYYISLHPGLKKDSTDVTIPSRLLARLGLPFHVLPSIEQLDGSFVSLNKQNTQMRDLAKSSIIYQHFLRSQGKVNITGNHSEIAREAYYDYHPRREVTGSFLAKHARLGKQPYVIDSFEHWLKGIRGAKEKWDINPLTLFEWEQISGNWGAIYVSEQDIAIDEFSPFNNRKLLITVLSVKHSYGLRNELYREMIREMWPETLQMPINPLPFPKLLKDLCKETLRGGLYYSYRVLQKGRGRGVRKRKEETT
ncbi:hypothetical protein [Brevibacillus invocatus]|uniref:hypothetical protein n=1 Tax=Brevibacillus invocatus TaxID=173959 RepID=UPI00203A7EE6|nr:hypothetical protein [Brevibacillus invocatus]MCM3079028.1 hypothetical protein [Brevibacillus invocatus]MCM3429909.1 hypothetical protein [Brevibacillus invocatus]